MMLNPCKVINKGNNHAIVNFEEVAYLIPVLL